MLFPDGVPPAAECLSSTLWSAVHICSSACLCGLQYSLCRARRCVLCLEPEKCDFTETAVLFVLNSLGLNTEWLP